MSFKPQIKKIIRLPKMQLTQNKQIVKMTVLNRGAMGISLKASQSADKSINPKTQRQEEEDKLRAELHQEIESRSRPCANRTYDCTLPRLQDRDYCARHILLDALAPYKQCTYVQNSGSSGQGGSSGRRCHLPAPVPHDLHSTRRDIGLCFEHAHSALISRQRNASSSFPPITPSTKLQKLQHYVKPERLRTVSSASAVSVVSDTADQDMQSIGAVVLDPFKQMDAGTVLSNAATTVLDYRSDSDSDSERIIGNMTGPAGADEDSSGPEDTPFSEDPLMCAGVYTTEEAVLCTRVTLVALQTAYLGQMNRLRKRLRQRRRRYLSALRREKETHCSIFTQVNGSDTLAGVELEKLKKLKAMTSFQKKFGVEAILARKLHEKRVKLGEGAKQSGAAGSSFSGDFRSKCTFSEGGVKCAQPSLPQAKHCRKHILQDANQVLFSCCGDTRAGLWCQETLPPPPTSVVRSNHTAVCVFHTDPPPYTVFTLRKDDSDTESGEEEIPDNSSEIGEVIEEVTIGTTEQSSSDGVSDNVIVDCLVSQESMNIYE